jgi:Abnormal spindle-like microcephaly-assoc'd, ASPM-SPD-2-Hydin/Immunoglobulin domain/Immunoglobulin I-set domain
MKINEHVRGKILSAAIPLVLFFVIGTPAHANVKINPASVNFGNQSVGATSAPVNLTLKNASGHKTTIVSILSSVAQFSYSWPSLPFTLGPGQELTGTVAFTPAVPQIYNDTLTFTAANGPSIAVSLSGTGVQTQSLATIQPASQTVVAGQTATFSASVSGATPVGYQWRKNGAAINGATVARYSTPPTTTSDNGAQFTVTVSTSTGSASSNPATLAVIASVVAPSITIQPVSQTVTAGQTATFSAAATGTTPLSYQWMNNGTPISGAISAAYTTPATRTSDTGSQFTITVSNSAGSVTSNAAVLTVTAAPTAPSITTQPASQTVTAGQTATFYIAATGTAPLSYQWMKTGTPISGATSSTYTTPVTTISDNGSQFTVMARNAAGNVTSNTATLTVNAAAVAPAITTQPTSQAVTAGQTGTFSAAATGTAPLSYQWKKNGTSISGATSSTYTTPSTTTSDAGSQFTVAVSNSAGSVTSNAAILTVNAIPGQLTVSASNLSFGNVNVGTSSSQSITFTNSGSSNITIASVIFSGAGFNVSGLSKGLILGPTQTATLNVIFAPAATGSATGSVAITSDAANSPASVGLSGMGVQSVTHSGTLSWIASSTPGVTGYNVYRATTSGGYTTPSNPTPISGTQFTDSTVQPGQTYYYVVNAIDAAGVESPYSNEVSGTTP